MGIMQMFKISSRQCHCVHECNTIGFSSVCIATVFVPKVESGEWVDVPKVELGQHRVKRFYNDIFFLHLLQNRRFHKHEWNQQPLPRRLHDSLHAKEARRGDEHEHGKGQQGQPSRPGRKWKGRLNRGKGRPVKGERSFNQYTGFTTHSATSGQNWKGQFSHLGSTLISIDPIAFTARFPSVSAYCRQAKRTPKPCIHSDHYCVGALHVLAHTKTHALSVHMQSDTQWYPGTYTKSNSYAVSWIGRCQLVPTLQCRNGPLLHVACYWWCSKLWIHSIQKWDVCSVLTGKLLLCPVIHKFCF